MKICCISDTHDKHLDLGLPAGDILLHAGDATMTGTKTQLANFVYWFSKQPFTHKIWIAGNHDWGMELDQTIYDLWASDRRNMKPHEISETRKYILQLCKDLGVIYLNNSGITIEGLNIWGSPDQPAFYNWAFNRTNVQLIEHWKTIPDNTNILITHAPAFGILDKLESGFPVGDEALTSRLQTLPNLKLHLAGHIHPSYGIKKVNGVTHVNASILDDRYQIANNPITLDLEDL